MELEYGYLYSREVNETLQKLFKTQFQWNMTKKMLKLKKEWNKNFEELKKEYVPLLDEYLEKDESGDFLKPEKIKAGKTRAELDSVTRDFMAKKFTIPVEKIKVKHLVDQGCRFSPEELEMLEPILDGVEDT